MIWRVITYILVPLVLITLWSALSYHYLVTQMETTFSIVEQRHFSAKPMDFFAGNIFKGEFKAMHSNLGQVGVRFDNNYRINDDWVTFRIKEKDQNEWFYEHTYKVDQFLPHKLFPFGFPVIPDSTGRTYVFEVESVQGSENNYVSLSPAQPIFTSRYEYPRQYIFSSPTRTIHYFVFKLINYLTDFSLLTTLFIYSLPLLFYVLLLITERSFFVRLTTESLTSALNKNFGTPVRLISLSVLADILFIHQPNGLLFFIPFALWVAIIMLVKPKPRVSLTLGLLNILLSIVLITFQRPVAAEKASAWAYGFIAIGLIQTTIYIHKK